MFCRWDADACLANKISLQFNKRFYVYSINLFFLISFQYHVAIAQVFMLGSVHSMIKDKNPSWISTAFVCFSFASFGQLLFCE